MRRLKIKICGMRDADNIRQAANLLPDYLGFIHYPGSPRYVAADFVILELPAGVTKVGVFVNESVEGIADKCMRNRIQTVQLHGEESPQIAEKLCVLGFKVIKAFSIDDFFSFEKLRDYQGLVDRFLFDTKGKMPGGNGVAFNWSRLDEYKLTIPFFLSGGLSLENISVAATLDHPQLFGLDLNSGIEVRPGLKNIAVLQKVLEVIKLKS